MQEEKTISIDLHTRLTQDLAKNLNEVAKSYGMKKSTLARVILQRELPNYTKNRLFA